MSQPPPPSDKSPPPTVPIQPVPPKLNLSEIAAVLGGVKGGVQSESSPRPGSSRLSTRINDVVHTSRDLHSSRTPRFFRSPLTSRQGEDGELSARKFKLPLNTSRIQQQQQPAPTSQFSGLSLGGASFGMMTPRSAAEYILEYGTKVNFVQFVIHTNT